MGCKMKIKVITAIKTKGEASQQAIEWQAYASKRNLSYGEIAEWQNAFEKLGRKFGLIKEFKENGII